MESAPVSILYDVEFLEKPTNRGRDATQSGTLELSIYPNDILAKIEEPTAGVRRVYALNNDYYFSLARSTPESDDNVVAMDLLANTSRESLWQYIESIYVVFDLYRIGDRFIWELFDTLQQDGGQIFDIAVGNGTEIISFKFKFHPDHFFLNTYSGGSVRLRFARHWFIESYQLDDKRGFSRQVELEPTQDFQFPIPLCESRENRISESKSGEIYYLHKITRRDRASMPTAAERCFLSAYGLPEPNLGSNWTLGLSLLGFGSALVVAAVFLWRFVSSARQSK